MDRAAAGVDRGRSPVIRIFRIRLHRVTLDAGRFPSRVSLDVLWPWKQLARRRCCGGLSGCYFFFSKVSCVIAISAIFQRPFSFCIT